MRRILLVVAYDGTAYSGWQIQPEAETIEGVLNRELSRFLGENINVIGASRTDAGVHAMGSVCVFDTESRIPAEKFSYALNTSLPEDIRIRKSIEVRSDFHPRKVPCKKRYEYRIWNDEFANPQKRLYYHHVYTKLDVEAMNEAAKAFVGEHDFSGFCSCHTQATTFVRTIYEASVFRKEDNREIIISVTGNGFLYNMVRIIAGTLIEVGQGRIRPEDMANIIDMCDRSYAGNTAPANGLCLMEYEFEEYDIRG